MASSDHEMDLLQVSSTSSDIAPQVTSQALSVVQSAASASSGGSESSPQIPSRAKSVGGDRAPSPASSRNMRAISPYARNKAKPKRSGDVAVMPAPAYACEASQTVAVPVGLPKTLSPTAYDPARFSGDGTFAVPPEIHLRKHQQLGIVVQGVDPREHAQMIAHAEGTLSSVRHEAQNFAARAEHEACTAQQQTRHIADQAQSFAARAESEVIAAQQQTQLVANQAEQVVSDLRQRNQQLELQHAEMRQQIASLQSVVQQLTADHAQRADTSQAHAAKFAQMIPKASESGSRRNATDLAAATEAMKELAAHVGQTMKELTQAVVASSPQGSPKKAKAKRKATFARDGIQAIPVYHGSAVDGIPATSASARSASARLRFPAPISTLGSTTPIKLSSPPTPPGPPEVFNIGDPVRRRGRRGW